ncbi:hypothetical protein [Clostridium formicaceticum]|uniref:Uncharacterized protein n=1 Tax=Clostridium formicaceticum TaxID=1497 RepID=A0AAC9WHF2_9CLOT|nr:hypothetical protein [Clostridium formicaceticum]AOY74676.1 hypothetical protein BJL90_01125 [Clostridium formicaceticum]ARE89052.1 hypothetical protein CLFO_34580 [Clostridium formicaceticum]
MLVNKTPLFIRGSILTKEMLAAMRDYPIDLIELGFINRGDGILAGFLIQFQRGTLIVGRGIFKYKDSIYVLTEEHPVKIPIDSGNYVLKIVVEDERLESNELGDYKCREFQMILDTLEPLKENEIELCRLGYSGQGSEVVSRYETFSDFHIVSNLVDIKHVRYADHSRVGTLHPIILKTFAKDMIKKSNLDAIDSVFVLQCLNAEFISRECIIAYLNLKAKKTHSKDNLENIEIYQLLREILEETRDKTTGIDNEEKQIQTQTKRQSIEVF